MTWQVEFHRLVLDEDLPSLDTETRRRVIKAVRKKLAVDPEAYGEPLRKELFGYWKLRVGEYRVVYHVSKGTVTVLILKIGIRRDSEVYSQMIARLKKTL